jgi:predicted nucleotidyltransferase
MLTIPQQVKKTVVTLDPEAKVILFGSRARGDSRKDSDWDFLILLPHTVSPAQKRKIRDLLYDIEFEADEVITSIIEEAQLWEAYRETSFFHNVNREGVEVKLPNEA